MAVQPVQIFVDSVLYFVHLKEKRRRGKHERKKGRSVFRVTLVLMKLQSILFYRDSFLHSNISNRNSIKAEVQLADPIDPVLFEDAVKTTMKRYPYYCVTLGSENGEYFFTENNRPVVILNSLASVTFNTEETNMHFVSFGYQDDWIAVNIFHGLTDGAGVYELLRTLLYYYCGARYGIAEDPGNVRLYGQPVSEEELYDPYADLPIKPLRPKPLPGPAVNIMQAIPEADRTPTAFHISVPERLFVEFCVKQDSTPGTMVCLLLCRIIQKLFPDAPEDIRFLLCTNDRKTLNAPKSCLNLVGTLPLDLKREMRGWTLTRQATVFRGMVFAEQYETNALNRAIAMKQLCETIRSLPDDHSRAEFAQNAIRGIAHSACGMVSYVGKSSFPNADPYIRDFRSLTGGSAALGVQIAVAAGFFKFDLIQSFRDDRYVRAFQEELRSYGIPSELVDTAAVDVSKAAFPWLTE